MYIILAIALILFFVCLIKNRTLKEGLTADEKMRQWDIRRRERKYVGRHIGYGNVSVRNCGDGWFSRNVANFFNPSAVCKQNGYGKGVDRWGGNWGHLCINYSNNHAGGGPTNMGHTVDWHCATPSWPKISYCASQNRDTCNRCNAGYIRYNNNKACARQISNCSSQNGNSCNSCRGGYKLSGNVCYRQIPNCSNQSGNTCYSCNGGKFLHSNKRSCVGRISNCASQTNEFCGKCVDGFYLSGDKRRCFPPVKNCVSQIADVCNQCKPGYKAGNNNRLCNLVPIPECKTQEGPTCKLCKEGYHLDKPFPLKNRCLVTPIDYCIDQRKIHCYKCQQKWWPSANKRKCDEVPAIDWCQNQHGYLCQNCADGYQLREDKKACIRKPFPEKGVTGRQGGRGGIGPTGARGISGVTGVKGKNAQKDDLGYRGPQGPKGSFGPTGPPGNVGPTGAVGHKGIIGPKGATTTINPWGTNGIVRALKNIYHKIENKNKKLKDQKNPPINLNISMGHLGEGDIKSLFQSSEIINERVNVEIKDSELNPARDKKENLANLEEFNNFSYIK